MALSIKLNPFLQAQMMMESGGNPWAVNAKSGASGLFQIRPDTARQPGFGVRPVDPFNSQDSARFASEYNAAMTRHFKDPALALMAYNWGPGNVQQWQRRGSNMRQLPLETQNYVKALLPLAKKYNSGDLRPEKEEETTPLLASGNDTLEGSSAMDPLRPPPGPDLGAMMLQLLNRPKPGVSPEVMALVEQSKPEPVQVDPMAYVLQGLAAGMGNAPGNARLGDLLFRGGIGALGGMGAGRAAQTQAEQVHRGKLADYALRRATLQQGAEEKDESRDQNMLTTLATLDQRRQQLAQTEVNQQASLAERREARESRERTDRLILELNRDKADNLTPFNMVGPGGETVTPTTRQEMQDYARRGYTKQTTGGGSSSFSVNPQTGEVSFSQTAPGGVGTSQSGMIGDKALARDAAAAGNPAVFSTPKDNMANNQTSDLLTFAYNGLAEYLDAAKKDPTLIGAAGSVRRAGQTVTGIAEDFAKLGIGRSIIERGDKLAREEGAGSGIDYDEFFGSSKLSDAQRLENSLAIALAKSRDPEGRLLKDQFLAAKKDTDITGLFGSRQGQQRLEGVLKELKAGRDRHAQFVSPQRTPMQTQDYQPTGTTQTPAPAQAAQPAPAQAKPLKPPPKVGTVEKGYRFKGGNPNDPASWEKVQ